MDVPPTIVDRPLIREDLFLTGTSIKSSQSRHHDDQFRQRHEADMADLRYQQLELRQSQQKVNAIVSTSATT